jgi:hypothetical protein
MSERKFARTMVWVLNGQRLTVTCVLQRVENRTELQLLFGERIAARYHFDDSVRAHRRASSLREHLILVGWADVLH